MSGPADTENGIGSAFEGVTDAESAIDFDGGPPTSSELKDIGEMRTALLVRGCHLTPTLLEFPRSS